MRPGMKSYFFSEYLLYDYAILPLARLVPVFCPEVVVIVQSQALQSSAFFLLAVALLTACGGRPPAQSSATPFPDPTQAIAAEANLQNLIPVPASVQPAGGLFEMTGSTSIFVEPGNDEVIAIGFLFVFLV